MFVRLVFLAGLFGLPFFGGCCANPNPRPIDAPPPARCDNMSRLGDEFAWCFADFQDIFFGLDYYDHMEKRFGNDPYR